MSWYLWSLVLWAPLLNFNLVYCILPEKSHYHHPVHHIYWNSSNPLFTKAESNSNAINHLRSTPVLNAHLLDTIVIHCPHYHIRQFRDLTEQSTLYLVSKRSFDGCQLDSSSRLLGYCDQLNNDRTIHVTLKRRGSKLGKFLPGRNYFIITTSTGRADGLYQREAGLCATKNMRLKIHILKEPYKTMKPVKFWMGSSREENDFIVSKQNDEEVLFMTEEFNELTWKKKLYDPRIPKSEQQRNFDLSSPRIVASSRNRVSRKFPKTHKVEDKDQPVPFLMHHHEMRRLPKSPVMIDGGNDSHVTDNDYFNDRTVEAKPRFRKIRHKKNRNGRFSIAHEHFWPSEEPSTGKLVLQEIDDDFDVASMNDITDKIELIRLDEYHQFNLDKKIRKMDGTKDQPSPEKLMFYDRPTDGVAPLLSGVEARGNIGNLLMLVMFFYFHVRRHLWT